MGTVATVRPTFDSAVAVLKMLPEDSQKKVLNFSIELLREEGENPFKPMTEGQLVQRIDSALEHMKEGLYEDAEDVENDIIAEFGLEGV